MNKLFIHETAVVDDGAQIGNGTKTWHFCHVMGTAKTGENCVPGQNIFCKYCFIGAGAVVTKDVKPYALMVGLPARQKGWISRSGAILGNDLVCPETGEKYKLADGFLKLL